MDYNPRIVCTYVDFANGLFEVVLAIFWVKIRGKPSDIKVTFHKEFYKCSSYNVYARSLRLLH